ncbi:MAG TPA: DUF4397 domain-containing protein, partial [Arachidicoccus soli]|nr:DUF4397 domain-containing protein [Arachidicoccus soli]
MKLIKIGALALFISTVIFQSCKKVEEGYVGDYPDKAKLIFINLAINGSAIPTQAKRDIAVYPVYNNINYNTFPIKYPWSNGYKVFEPGALTLRLDTALSPGNDPPGSAGLAGTYNLNLQANSYYSMFAVGTVQNIDTFLVKDNIDYPTPGKTKIMFLNLSADAGPIDIVDANTNTILAANVSYKERRAYIEVNPGTYSMRIQAAGTSTVIKAPKTGMVISPNSV